MDELRLIDTSAWIEYFRKDGDSATRTAVSEAIRTKQATWCESIRLELMRGNAKQRKQADLITETFPCLSIDEVCWQEAYDLATHASEAGKPMPNTDILIQACAIRHKAILVHRDHHFETLADL